MRIMLKRYSEKEAKVSQLNASVQKLFLTNNLMKYRYFIVVEVHFLKIPGKKRSMDESNEATPATKMMKQETPENTVVAAVQSFKSKLNEAIMKWKLDLPTYNTVRTAGGFLSTLVFNGQGMRLFFYQ